MASSPRTGAASSRVRSGASAMINRPDKLPEIEGTPQTDEPEPCALTYRSGWLLDRLFIGATLYVSEPLYAPADRDGTSLLQDGQRGYAVLGQLYARVKLFEGQFLNLYRQTYDTPYMNRNDNRITP